MFNTRKQLNSAVTKLVIELKQKRDGINQRLTSKRYQKFRYI